MSHHDQALRSQYRLHITFQLDKGRGGVSTVAGFTNQTLAGNHHRCDDKTLGHGHRINQITAPKGSGTQLWLPSLLAALPMHLTTLQLYDYRTFRLY
jgi:hypothetical protein